MEKIMKCKYSSARSLDQ